MNKNKFNLLKAYPLGDDDLTELNNLERDNIFSYDKIFNVGSIDELLDNSGRGILLFRNEADNVGHWIGLLKKGNNIEIFDPYGYKSNEWNKRLGGSLENHKEWRQDRDYLLQKLNDDGYNVIQSKRIFQPRNNQNNQTCGKVVSLRLLLHKLNQSDFYKFMDNIKKNYGINTNDLATGLSYTEIGK